MADRLKDSGLYLPSEQGLSVKGLRCLLICKWQCALQIAMRWRTEHEVVNGKGQFSCGNKICPEAEGLRTWEVNFAYREQEEKKNALVKLRK